MIRFAPVSESFTPRTALAECSKGAGINRVSQDVVDSVVHLGAFHSIDCRPKLCTMEGRIRIRLLDRKTRRNALQLVELVENETDRVLHATIGIFLDPVIVGLQIANRHGPDELAAPGLLLNGLGSALAEDRQLHLAHGSLHAK